MENERNIIGIIPAAGKGVRFKELGKNYPKAILPYKEKPILIHNVRWMIEQGCSEVRIVVNHQAFHIVEILDQFLTKEERAVVTCMNQPDTSGLSKAIDAALYGNEDSILILLGDLLPTSDIKKFVSLESGFISTKYVSDYSRWCMVETTDPYSEDIVAFHDKPSIRPNTHLAVSGIYYFTNPDEIKKLLTKQFENNETIRGEYQLSTVMAQLEGLKAVNYIDLLDFGTLEEYLINKDSNRTREFNKIRFLDDLVIKSSVNKGKMLAETSWFENLPNDLKLFTPRLLDKNIFQNNYDETEIHPASYTLERVHSTTLRELFLFLDSSDETWSKIIDKITRFLALSTEYPTEEKGFLRSMFHKTLDRVEQSFSREMIENKHWKLVKNFLEDFDVETKKSYGKNCIIHGDLCFSNMLYNTRTSTLKLIDPRGDMFGNQLYDIAKIYHSVFYNYDFIDSDLYSYDQVTDVVKIYDKGKEVIREKFANVLSTILSEEERKFVHLLTASLFISMIPLHSDKPIHQKLFVKEFQRAYANYKEM